MPHERARRLFPNIRVLPSFASASGAWCFQRDGMQKKNSRRNVPLYRILATSGPTIFRNGRPSVCFGLFMRGLGAKAV